MEEGVTEIEEEDNSARMITPTMKIRKKLMTLDCYAKKLRTKLRTK